MVDGFKAAEICREVAREVVSNEKLLCELDSKVGDGDHGVTVARGFKAVSAMLEEESFGTPGECFAAVGKKLSVSMGGAVGPFLGAFFSAGASKNLEKEIYDIEDFLGMFEAGLKKIQLLGEAKVGDRTMVDALYPALNAYKEAMQTSKTLEECFDAASKAAKEGAESTKEMVAKKGRAKFLGEKSKGYVDAGATTMAIIIETMSRVVSNS